MFPTVGMSCFKYGVEPARCSYTTHGAFHPMSVETRLKQEPLDPQCLLEVVLNEDMQLAQARQAQEHMQMMLRPPTEDARERRNHREAERKRKLRASMDPAARDELKAIEAAKKRMYRASMTWEEREAMRIKERQRKREKRRGEGKTSEGKGNGGEGKWDWGHRELGELRRIIDGVDTNKVKRKRKELSYEQKEAMKSRRKERIAKMSDEEREQYKKRNNEAKRKLRARKREAEMTGKPRTPPEVQSTPSGSYVELQNAWVGYSRNEIQNGYRFHGNYDLNRLGDNLMDKNELENYSMRVLKNRFSQAVEGGYSESFG